MFRTIVSVGRLGQSGHVAGLLLSGLGGILAPKRCNGGIRSAKVRQVSPDRVSYGGRLQVGIMPACHAGISMAESVGNHLQRDAGGASAEP